MAYYLDEKEVCDAFVDDEKKAQQYFEKFDELERVAAARPLSKIPKGFEFLGTPVTDGSLAAALNDITIKVCQSLPTGLVKTVDKSAEWIAELANIELKKYIIPNANFENTFRAKNIDWFYRALKYEAQPPYYFLSSVNGYTGVDFVLPYVKHVILEGGKVSDLACDRMHFIQHYSKSQIKRLIDKCKKEDEAAKAEKRKSNNTWITKKLQELLDKGAATKEDKEKTLDEKDKSDSVGVFKIIHCFQRDEDAPTYSFAPSLGTGKESIVRKVEKDGDISIVFMYTGVERTAPYGVSKTALALPNQNVQDALTQAQMVATFQGIRPPLKVKGKVQESGMDLSTIAWKPDAKMIVGSGDVEAMRTDSAVYSQFPITMGFYKTQQQKLIGLRDNSISAQSGDPQFSKVPAGIKDNKDNNDSHLTFLMKCREEAYERLITGMLNKHMAVMQNTHVLEVTEDESSILEKAGMKEIDRDENGVITTKEIEIAYEKMRGKYKFSVDSNSSKEENDAADADELSSMIELITGLSNMPPTMQFGQYQFDTGEFANAIFRKKGLPEIDKFLKKMDPNEQMAVEEQAQAQAQEQEQVQAQQEPPMQQMPSEPTEDITARAMQLAQTHGLFPELAMQVAQMEQRGVDPEQIVNYLRSKGALNGR